MSTRRVVAATTARVLLLLAVAIGVLAVLLVVTGH